MSYEVLTPSHQHAKNCPGWGVVGRHSSDKFLGLLQLFDVQSQHHHLWLCGTALVCISLYDADGRVTNIIITTTLSHNGYDNFVMFLYRFVSFLLQQSARVVVNFTIAHKTMKHTLSNYCSNCYFNTCIVRTCRKLHDFRGVIMLSGVPVCSPPFPLLTL